MHTLGLQPYRTPDKRPQPDNSTKGFSSAISRPWEGLESSAQSLGKPTTSQYRPLETKNSAFLQKLAWYESRTEQLRAYIEGNPQIEHAKVRQIFEWAAESPPEEAIQQRILKDLSTKVRALIKENSELRSISPAEEVISLRSEKAALQSMIDQLKRGESAREAILSEENQYLRDYISRRKQDIQRQKPHQDTIRIDQEEGQSAFRQSAIKNQNVASNQNDIANLRRYVMAYINTVIESNDEKLEAQQKYLSALQKRVAQVDKFEGLLTHLHFEKAVKLQQSTRKSKNFTAGAPSVVGDYIEYEEQPSPVAASSDPTKKYFSSRQKKESPQNKQSQQNKGKQMAALVLRSAQLQQELTALQQKYEVEIENHIRDSSNREELNTNIQKLTAQRNDLKHQVYQFQEEKRAASRKAEQLEKRVGKLRSKQREQLLGLKGISIQEQLAEMKKELLSCGIDHFQVVERQLTEVFSERDRLQKQLESLQSSYTENSRFSAAHKQIFLLRQKNNQLELNCRFYEQQITEYEQQLRKMSEENEQRLAKAISRDFKDMRGGNEQVSGLKWTRMAHSCMLNSIARLQNIEKQLSAQPSP